MLGSSALVTASASESNQRVFLYEVEGLHQNTRADQNCHQIRNSSTILIRIPYNRMNQEMRRITRLGGKIVGIHTASPTTED